MANENYVCKIIYEIHKENSRIWENWVLIDASNRKSGPLVWQLHAVDALPAPFRIRKISINSTNWQPVFVVCSQTVHTTHFSLRIIFLTNSNGAPAAVRYMIGTLLTPDVRLKPSPKATHVMQLFTHRMCCSMYHNFFWPYANRFSGRIRIRIKHFVRAKWQMNLFGDFGVWNWVIYCQLIVRRNNVLPCRKSFYQCNH